MTLDPLLALTAAVLVVVLAVLLVTMRPEKAVVWCAWLSLVSVLAVPLAQVSGIAIKLAVLVACIGLPTLGLTRGGARPPRAVWLFPASVAAYLPASLFAPIEERSLYALGLTAAASIPLSLLVSTLDDKQRRAFGRLVIVTAVVAALYAFAEFREQWRPLWFSYSEAVVPGAPRVGLKNNLLADGSLRAQVTFGHPLALTTLILVALALTLTAQVVTKRCLVVLLVATFFGVFVVNGSRSGVAIGAVLVAVFLASRRTGFATAMGRLPLLAIVGGTVALLGFGQTATVQSLLQGESVVHRASSIGSVSSLLSQESESTILFGNGFRSGPRLFESGAFGFYDGTEAIDNMWIAALAAGGLLSLALAVSLFIVAIRRADLPGTALLAAFAGAFFIFDVYMWPSAVALFGMTYAWCVGSARTDRHADQANVVAERIPRRSAISHHSELRQAGGHRKP